MGLAQALERLMHAAAPLRERWALGFFGAVAGFLALTGGLKLWSVLQETRVLGVPDPLLNWLTVRQVVFAAAVLELGVALVLWRHRTARWVPWLVLWLVAFFGAYRLGLWSVGFQGHCACLGRLLADWPGGEVWADRLMLGALGVMMVGSVGCLWAGRREQAHGASATRSRVRGLVGLLLGMIWVVASRPAAAGAASAEEAIRIGARGRVKASYLDKGLVENLRFEIAVEGRRVSSRMTGFSEAYSQLRIEAAEFHYDGELAYEMIINPPDLLVPQMVIDPKTGQPHGDPTTLVRPLDDANMRLRYRPIPLSTALPAWIAFASLPYLEKWANGQMEKLFDLAHKQRREPLLVPGVLKRHDAPPHAPELLITLDPRQRGVTNEAFRVIAWQEVGGLTWPKRFVFEIYQSHFEPKGRLLTVEEYEVEELFIPEGPVSGKPQFQGRIHVDDERFLHDPVPLSVVGYFITNSVVPTMEAVRGMRAYAAQVEYERSRIRRAAPWPWQALFWSLLAVPAIWYLVQRYKTRVSSHKTPPIP